MTAAALLLAEGLEAIAREMQAAGRSRRPSAESMITHGSRLSEPPRDSEITASSRRQLLPSIRHSSPPPSARVSGSSRPVLSRPGGSPGLPATTAAARWELSQIGRPVRAEPADYTAAVTSSRPVSYYILLGVPALALFAISMFLTILVLR